MCLQAEIVKGEPLDPESSRHRSLDFYLANATTKFIGHFRSHPLLLIELRRIEALDLLQSFGCESSHYFVGKESCDGNAIVPHFGIGCRLHLLYPTEVKAHQISQDSGVGLD